MIIGPGSSPLTTLFKKETNFDTSLMKKKIWSSEI